MADAHLSVFNCSQWFRLMRRHFCFLCLCLVRTTLSGERGSKIQEFIAEYHLQIEHDQLNDLISHTQVLEPRQLFVYSSYKDIQIFHYVVPQQVLLATWSFSAVESGGCSSKQIMLYLQHGSYPVISPDNATYPTHFYLRRSALHEIGLRSDLTPTVLNITTPEPGDWFVAAFLPEKSDRIEQKGLSPVCRTLLSSSINFTMEHNVVHLLPGVSMPQKTESPQYYKFYVPENTWTARIMVKNCATVPAVTDRTSECPILLYARPSVLHVPDNVAEHFANCSDSYRQGQCVLDFIPRENSWHYVWLDLLVPKVEYRIIIETSVCENGYSPSQYLVLSEFNIANSNNSMPVNKDSLLSVPSSYKRVFMPLPFNAKTRALTPTCWPRVPLLKKTYPGNFIFSYEQLPNANGTTPIKLDISNTVPTLLVAPIQPVLDIGGTLVFELSLDFFMNVSVYNVTVVACIEKDERALVHGPSNCTSPLSLQVNTSRMSTMQEYVMLPFPEPGNWYVTIAAYCYVLSPNGTVQLDDTSYEVVNCETNTTTVMFSILSSSCIYGICGPYGRCYQYISGGFIFSTCVCTAGWSGWGCTDNSNAIPDFELLLATLLLTLSNLLFIPAVILSVYRRFFTEALVFFLTMFFSTFYHACDEDAYTFCLMRLSVMQFCDFYLAVMSVWVTLVAMADLHPKVYSLLHMAGAVGVALGVEYDRTGLWVFVVPSVTGILILTASWIWRCRQQKACYPEPKVWFLCLLPGVVLAGAGMAFFAFVETEENYKYVHSGWHAAMALSILFLLPPARDKLQHQQHLPQQHHQQQHRQHKDPEDAQEVLIAD